jgi:septal ring factor EnvC (AmiA/AmiB activator)
METLTETTTPKCPICLEMLKPVSIPSCGHACHSTCQDTWIAHHPNHKGPASCAVCRQSTITSSCTNPALSHIQQILSLQAKLSHKKNKLTTTRSQIQTLNHQILSTTDTITLAVQEQTHSLQSQLQSAHTQIHSLHQELQTQKTESNNINRQIQDGIRRELNILQRDGRLSKTQMQAVLHWVKYYTPL